MKTISLLKAVLTEDMNLFKYTSGKNASKINKAILPIVLFLIFMFSIGYYAYLIAEPLHQVNLTYIMLSMFIFIISIITLIEGIYKSQGILFETKDNDLLFSLPISKKKILFVRIFKLMLFQYLYNLMFLLPTIGVYIYFEHPGINFYLISFIMTFLIPILPTVVSSILGYFVKLISSKFKSKKIVQTILSSIIFMGIFFLSMNLNGFLQDIAVKAKSINDILTRIYYPVGAYVTLINDFNIWTLIKLLLINIVPFLLFILLGAKLYFKIIYSSEGVATKKNKVKKEIFKKKPPVYALTIKELRRYFSSPIYMFNTIFGLLLILVLTIILCIKEQGIINTFLESEEISINISISLLYYVLVLFSCSMTSITSSCISLEGKTINITKSLPVSEKVILKSKIIYPFIIELPFILISELIFFIKFKTNIVDIILIISMSLITIALSGIIGLIINLKYPKMNAKNDTEVVKQSISSMLSVFIGIGIFILSIILIIYFYKILNVTLLLIMHVFILLLLTLVLYCILMKFGIEEYKKINV